MMKKFGNMLSAFLAVLLLLGSVIIPASAKDHPFTDVPEDAWYQEAVAYAYENGLFQGNTATEFAPNASMTRAMFVQVLANRAENYSKADWEGRSTFSDVKRDKWYAAPIEWASKAGLVSGTGNGRFDPESNVSREQMAVILYNYAKKTGNDASFDDGALEGFSDASEIASWAEEAMKWAITHRVVRGSNGKIDPKSNAKRCEVAQVCVNAKEVLVKNLVEIPAEEPEPSPEPSPEPDPVPGGDGGSGGGGGGTKPTPTPTPMPTPTPPPADSPLLQYSTVSDWGTQLTRQQSAELFVALYETLGGEEIVISPDVSFPDIKPDNQVVLKAASAGLMSGDYQGRFNPGYAVTRAETAAFCMNTMDQLLYCVNIPAGTVPPSDVKDTTWYYYPVNYLCWAVGYPEETFRPQERVIARDAFDWMDALLKRYEGITPDGLKVAENPMVSYFRNSEGLYSLKDRIDVDLFSASDRDDYYIARGDIYELLVMVSGQYGIKDESNPYLDGEIDPYAKIVSQDMEDGWNVWRIGDHNEVTYRYKTIDTGPATRESVLQYTYQGKTLECDPRKLPDMQAGKYVTDEYGIRWAKYAGVAMCSLRDVYAFFGISSGFSLEYVAKNSDGVDQYAFLLTGPVDGPSVPEGPADPDPDPNPGKEIQYVTSSGAAYYRKDGQLYRLGGSAGSFATAVFAANGMEEQYVSAGSLYDLLVIRNGLYDVEASSNPYLAGELDIYSRITRQEITEEGEHIWYIGEEGQVVYSYQTVYTGPASRYTALTYTYGGKKLTLDSRFSRELYGEYGVVDGVRYTNIWDRLYVNYQDVCAFFGLPATLTVSALEGSADPVQDVFSFDEP